DRCRRQLLLAYQSNRKGVSRWKCSPGEVFSRTRPRPRQSQPAPPWLPAKLEKKAYSCEPVADNATSATPLFSSAVSYGNLLFLAGVGAHFKGTVEEHTKHVLEELEKNLINAGSSMD